MKLQEIREAYLNEGLDYDNASARACQEAFLTVVKASSFAGNVTFKGGVVMQQVSGDNRRATQDIDFDFMRYSIADDSIRAFIDKLNANDSGIALSIVAPIQELKHQDYNGKRVLVAISDEDGTSIGTKLDIGVLKDMSVAQRDICFDIPGSDDSISLLANTDEQMVAEKLKSLLRFRFASTRYKDVFDMYYQFVVKGMDHENLGFCMKRIVFDDGTVAEREWSEVHDSLSDVFTNRSYMSKLERARDNWLELPAKQVTEGILAAVKEMG